MRQNKFLYLFFLVAQFVHSQKNDSSLFVFKQTELELKQLQKPVFYSEKETDKFEANKQFIATWDRIVGNPKILNYAFDSLKEVSVLRPKDHKFTIITWNIPRKDGSHVFFGYLLVNTSKRVKKGFFRYQTEQSYDYFKLLDRSMNVKTPETYVGYADKWFGMLYTQLIECDDFYTLIGWDGNTKLSQRKFIDVLWFKPDGTPVFGKDVFKLPKKNPRRLMFEYSSEVSMSLKYDEKRNQIVYSHLASSQEGALLEGQFQFYGPDGSYDALNLIKNKWVLEEKIDARNEKNEKDNSWNNPKDPTRKKNKKIMPKNKGR